MVVFHWTWGTDVLPIYIYIFKILSFIWTSFHPVNLYQLHYNPSGVITLRGNWEISRRELQNPQIIAMVTSDHDYMDTDFNEYSAPSQRSLICCRLVAIIVISLSLFPHTHSRLDWHTCAPFFGSLLWGWQVGFMNLWVNFNYWYLIIILFLGQVLFESYLRC